MCFPLEPVFTRDKRRLPNFMDEPTSGLDFRHMCQVEKLMKRLAEEKYIIIVVTHDYEFLNRTCKGYIRINSRFLEDD